VIAPERLQAALVPVLGSDVEIDNLRALTGGASRGTWAFDARIGGQERSDPGNNTETGAKPLILRTGPPDDIHAGMELEARAQRLAADAGAPVPHVLFATDSTAQLGKPFLVCEAIAGETIPRKILRSLDDEQRPELLRQCAHALAAIHRAQADAPSLEDRDELAQTRVMLDGMGDTTATFEWAFRWLATKRPEPVPGRLVHGDFRMGNLIIEGARLAAVLDWELVHIGDCYEDLAWFCIRAWRFGEPAIRGAGGLGSIESFLSDYEDAAGTTVDRVRFRWWLVMATLRWGVICRYQAHRHLSGQTRSVELAAIGRRVAETEWDVLDLLDTRAVA
jgi:aminoglycoside phosphotransferase (APT) family kinase protein